MRKPYTKQELQSIITYYNEPMQAKDIANKLNRPTRSIETQIIKLKKANLIKPRQSQEEILKELQAEQNTLTN